MVAAAGSSGRAVDRNGSVLVETSSTSKERKESSVLEMDAKTTVGGGVEDVYGEDSATEDQLVTPWTVSVARYNRS